MKEIVIEYFSLNMKMSIVTMTEELEPVALREMRVRLLEELFLCFFGYFVP